MKKIKITKEQKRMIESYINEDIPFGHSPTAKVTSAFKSAGANKISGVKVESKLDEIIVDNIITIGKLTPKVLEFVKLLYLNPVKDALDPFWGEVGVSWDTLIDLLTKLKLIKSVGGGYRLVKQESVDLPSVIKIATQLIYKLINDVSKEGIEEDNYPPGAANDQTAPYNQSLDIKSGNKVSNDDLKLKLYLTDLCIFDMGGKQYIYTVESGDNDEYAEYADREETVVGHNEDGVKDVEYGPWTMNGNIVTNYVNDNIEHLSKGVGVEDFERGVELVEINGELAKDLLGLVKFITSPLKAKRFTDLLKNIDMSETTTAGSSGAFVGKMSVGPKLDNNVVSNMGDALNEEGELTIEELVMKLEGIAPIEWLQHGQNIEGLVTQMGDDELAKSLVDLLQIADIIQDLSGKEESAESYNKLVLLFDGKRDKIISEFGVRGGIEEVTTVGSVGGDSGTFAYDAPAGDGSNFWNAGNKMNKKSANESAKLKPKDIPENAQTDTQWPNGEFVEFDDCTKLNNNKDAQNGGCSTGAVDNVVKTKGSVKSVISKSK